VGWRWGKVSSSAERGRTGAFAIGRCTDGKVSTNGDLGKVLKIGDGVTSLLQGFDLQLFLFAVAASSWVKVRSVFVSHLSAALSSSILSSFRESSIPIGSDGSVVESSAVNEPETSGGILFGIILGETEATRSLSESIQSHDDSFDLSRSREKFVDLFFGREEGKVTDV